MGFKDNLEEKEELYDYRKKEKIFFFIFFLVISFFVLMILTGGEAKFSKMLIRVPFLREETRTQDIVLLVLMVSYFFWYKGIKVPKFLQKAKIVEENIEKIEKGKVKQLEEFFYPVVEFSDGIPRGKGLYYFKSKKRTIYNLFDFGKYTKKNGTKQIIAAFRDKKIEEARKRARIERGKKKRGAENELQKLLREQKERVATPNQENLYTDLFLMFEGIYNSYANDFGDKIFIDTKMKNPIKITKFKKSGRIAGVTVDTSIDVFRDAKVHFSIDMVMQTAQSLTYLYIIFLEKRLKRGRFSKIKRENLERFEMFFKFFITRRILLNYSNIPSGWLCVKIEDYTMRAIASNIDREMIIDINSKNDGSNPAYNSDVEASQFLFTYWAFFYEDKIRKIMDEVEFIYNATKEIKEINAREMAREAMKEIEKEWKQEYDSFSDKDIIELQPKDVEDHK